jgi:glutamate--cysteine ligase
VPRTALRTPFRRTTLLEVARQVLAIAQAGLQRRVFANAKGEDERIFLEPVEAILRDGLTPADEILLRYERDWGRRTLWYPAIGGNSAGMASASGGSSAATGAPTR